MDADARDAALPPVAAVAGHQPPAAPLTYLVPREEPRHYGRADCPLIAASTFVVGANVSFVACLWFDGGLALWGVWEIAVWVFFALHMLLWAGGQVLFWTCHGHERPRFSAVALAFVGAAGVVTLFGNAAYTYFATQ